MFSAVVVVCITFRVVFTMLCARFDGSKVTHCARTVVAVQSQGRKANCYWYSFHVR